LDAKSKEQYDQLIASINMTEQEECILSKVREGLLADSKSSPWFPKEWRQSFVQNNTDSMSFSDAPFNEFIMVTSESLGTIYKHDRGQSLMRGSLILRLSDTLIYSIEGSSWYASPTKGAIVFSQQGYFEVHPESSDIYGTVKLLNAINV
jgi:hypothetical protein